jgi:hypothetical protein
LKGREFSAVNAAKSTRALQAAEKLVYISILKGFVTVVHRLHRPTGDETASISVVRQLANLLTPRSGLTCQNIRPLSGPFVEIVHLTKQTEILFLFRD